MFIKISSRKIKKTTNKKELPMGNKFVSLESIHKDFSSFGGIKIYDQMYNLLNIESHLSSLLTKPQIKKYKTLLFSFICGADCLDDLDWLRLDSLFCNVTNNGIASTTAGEFLRLFNIQSIEELEQLLISVSLNQRRSLKYDNKFELSIDSTPHI
ncbi:MAG: hypothetical protein H6622_12635 [Halobacteriovoraceae bacterium]|nr:hypothetical protein [Halobacteriovoraceae bacterium]